MFKQLAIICILWSGCAVAQQGVYYTYVEPPAQNPSGGEFHEIPPSILDADVNSPLYWQLQKHDVLAKDQTGNTLKQRADKCDDRLNGVQSVAHMAMQFLENNDIAMNPQTGYIPHGFVMNEQQTVRTYMDVAIRDMRYAKYDNANLDKCQAISDFAIYRINRLVSKYPKDN